MEPPPAWLLPQAWSPSVAGPSGHNDLDVDSFLRCNCADVDTQPPVAVSPFAKHAHTFRLAGEVQANLVEVAPAISRTRRQCLTVARLRRTIGGKAVALRHKASLRKTMKSRQNLQPPWEAALLADEKRTSSVMKTWWSFYGVFGPVQAPLRAGPILATTKSMRQARYRSVQNYLVVANNWHVSSDFLWQEGHEVGKASVGPSSKGKTLWCGCID